MTHIAEEQHADETEEHGVLHHLATSFGEDDEEFDKCGDDERGDCPGNDGDETLETLDEDDAGAEDHDELVGYTA